MSAPLANGVRNADPSTSIEIAEQRVEAWHDPEWQRLWLAVEPRPWRSLALIPAADGASLEFTLVVAMTLSRTGMVHLGRPIQIADATQVPLSQLSAFTDEVRRCADAGQRLLIALPPTSKSAITASIAQSLDAALLCILAGRMSSSQAKETVKLVGATRFLGTAIFHPHQVGNAR